MKRTKAGTIIKPGATLLFGCYTEQQKEDARRACFDSVAIEHNNNISVTIESTGASANFPNCIYCNVITNSVETIIWIPLSCLY